MRLLTERMLTEMRNILRTEPKASAAAKSAKKPAPALNFDHLLKMDRELFRRWQESPRAGTL